MNIIIITDQNIKSEIILKLKSIKLIKVMINKAIDIIFLFITLHTKNLVYMFFY